MSNNSKTSKKLTASLISLIVMAICLAISTFAIVYSIVSIESNLFATGTVKINLNNGERVITPGEDTFEPGATLKRDFFIENQSSCEVYYKMYFKNVGGGLADVINIKICDGDKVLVEGKPTELTKKEVPTVETSLGIGEKKELQIYFCFPAEAGNTAQDQSLLFDFAAEAVQTINNPDKSFE